MQEKVKVLSPVTFTWSILSVGKKDYYTETNSGTYTLIYTTNLGSMYIEPLHQFLMYIGHSNVVLRSAPKRYCYLAMTSL